MGKLVVILSVVGAMGCAAGSSPGQAAPKRDVHDSPRTRTSTASVASGGLKTSPTIRVRVGVVRVVHSVSGQARLRGTHLQGLDDHNRGVEYTWAENGEYRVEVSGRYRHSVLGAIVGNQRSTRLVSTVTYEELPDTTHHVSVPATHRLGAEHPGAA